MKQEFEDKFGRENGSLADLLEYLKVIFYGSPPNSPLGTERRVGLLKWLFTAANFGRFVIVSGDIGGLISLNCGSNVMDAETAIQGVEQFLTWLKRAQSVPENMSFDFLPPCLELIATSKGVFKSTLAPSKDGSCGVKPNSFRNRPRG